MINLDSETKRMDVLDKHLNECGLSHYERVSAETKPAEDMSTWMHTMCPKGVGGSAASHRKIWKEVISKNLDMAMILEDDVRFVDGAMDELDKALEDLPEDFDILYVGSSGLNNAEIQEPKDLLLYPVSLYTGRTGKKISDRLVAPLAPYDIHAYIISNKGAKKLLEQEQFLCFLDSDINITRGINMYACSPSLASQADEEFGSHSATTFPYLVTGVFGRGKVAPNIKWLELFNTFPISIWVVVFGIISAFNPIFLLVLLPDVYWNFNMVMSTLLIMFLTKLVL